MDFTSEWFPNHIVMIESSELIVENPAGMKIQMIQRIVALIDNNKITRLHDSGTFPASFLSKVHFVGVFEMRFLRM